ncbi:MAG: nitroreductase family protein [Caulobacteraceae bacterium]
MPVPVPPEPEFGAPVAGPSPSPEGLALLALRRSASAVTLAEPGPGEAEVRDLLRIGARVPDHGKMFPWRFIVLSKETRAEMAAKLAPFADGQPDPAKARATLAKLTTPPVTIAVISRLTESKIPDWEQQLSAGAVCQTLLLAAQAMGYGANWITDWYAYDLEGRALLGLDCNERVAGFVHIGTPPSAPLERVRPDVDSLTEWR